MGVRAGGMLSVFVEHASRTVDDVHPCENSQVRQPNRVAEQICRRRPESEMLNEDVEHATRRSRFSGKGCMGVSGWKRHALFLSLAIDVRAGD